MMLKFKKSFQTGISWDWVNTSSDIPRLCNKVISELFNIPETIEEIELKLTKEPVNKQSVKVKFKNRGYRDVSNCCYKNLAGKWIDVDSSFEQDDFMKEYGPSWITCYYEVEV